MLSQVTYIWIDGAEPTHQLRCKMRVVHLPENPTLQDFPSWGYDGSSTYQAEGSQSDLYLEPAYFVTDPLQGAPNYLLLCEVFQENMEPHPTNTRALLRAVLENGGSEHEPWVGFEQEYTLLKGQTPLGWPERGYPAPQGPFYCGVGADQVFGRDLVEDHTQACLDAGLMLFGTNAEVMPGQWEFQIGYRNVPGESADPLTVSDHLWLARWLLYRIGEDYGVYATLHPKPIKGDWNGAGKHTNFSTKLTRDEKNGMTHIQEAIERLRPAHAMHVKNYGAGLEERLTGLHETAAITEFTHGIASRNTSIRIPQPVADKGYGYFEDRRPGANADPYIVCMMLVKTVCAVCTV